MAATCDAQALVNEAVCIECGVPPGMYVPILIALFCEILAQGGGGGGGSGSVLQGAVDPVAPPPDPTKPALYTNLTSGSIFTWNVTAQAWQ